MTVVSTMNDTTESVITIYKEGFGVVKEKRKLIVPSQDMDVQYLDVAQQIETNSLIVSGLEIYEYNYDFDFIDKKKILDNYLDKTVFLYDKASGTKTECTLLSTKGGIVLENKHTKKIIINPSEKLVLPKLPNGLITKPALIWKVKSAKSEEISVSYITKGLAWSAHYVMELRENRCDLIGWVNISNTCGTTYEKTKVKLIDGEFNRNIYALEQRTSLKNNQDKQISFCSVLGIRYREYYEFNGEATHMVLELDNAHINQLGIPLPKGSVKVYQVDSQDESLEFVGEDVLNHNPESKGMKLHIREAYEVNCKVNKVDHNKNGRRELSAV